MKKVVIFGAGMVTRPPIRYLLNHGFQVTVATRTKEKAENTLGGHPNGRAVAFDVTAPDMEKSLELLIQEHDLAISLLPYIYHVVIAKACIKYGKDMVTTSYVSPAMKALDEDAKKAGIIILNEIGVDPGIDHMSAMQIIDRIKKQGGEIESFSSCCGGLPSPETEKNPFGYKFSWSPRGVVMAGRNSGKFLRDGNEVFIPGEELFHNYWKAHIDPIGDLEFYTNRDSFPYIELYNLQGIKSIFRGTFRYPGWCSTLAKIAQLGFLDEKPWENVKTLTYKGFMKRLIKKPQAKDVKKEVAKFLGIDIEAEEIKKLEWLGLFGDETITMKQITPMDVLVELLLEKLQYKDGEPDMIVLVHDFVAKYPDRKEEINSTLICYGEPNGDTAMAKTVGIPAAIGTRLILEGKIDLKGVRIPVYPEIYEPVLAELAEYGVKFEEQYETIEQYHRSAPQHFEY